MALWREACELDNLSDYHAHLIVYVDGEAYVIPVPLIRKIANGQELADNKISQCLAVALLERINA